MGVNNEKMKNSPTPSKAGTLGMLKRILGMDGYANATAFLGEASPLASGGTFVRGGVTRNPELLTNAYRESWLAKRIIDTPSEDMTRSWYQLTAAMSKEDREAMARLEARHSIKQEMTNAIRWARLYGGSLALMVIRGEERRLEEPLDTGLLMPGCFQGLLVLDRTQGIEPSNELETDLDDPDFGLPMYYTVDLGYAEARTVKIHHSRVLRFVGRELPAAETIRESYWGASELEHIWEELMKRNSTSANIAELVFQANITTLKIGDLGEKLGMETDDRREEVYRALSLENHLRTSFGVQLLSSTDDMDRQSYNFAGLPEIYAQFMMDMSGAAEIPATKLFGRSPQGMNSTGESDLQNYYEMIASLQERMLRPALERLLPVMAASCLSEIPEDFQFVFEPISPRTAAEQMRIAKEHTELVMTALEKGAITVAEARKELKNFSRRTGVFADLDEGGEDDAGRYEEKPD